jgi:hypothetical protein
MNPPLRLFIRTLCGCCAGLTLCWPAPGAGAGLPREDGPVQATLPPEQPSVWKEQALALPAYPAAGKLLELDVNTPGFRTYIDPGSLTAGKDGVVRFTTVQVSASGVRNVTYEGLHCGAQRYRRLAYGNAGKWHELKAGGWQRLPEYGDGKYRKYLYFHYMCNPVEPYGPAQRILRRLRSSRSGFGD